MTDPRTKARYKACHTFLVHRDANCDDLPVVCRTAARAERDAAARRMLAESNQ